MRPRIVRLAAVFACVVSALALISASAVAAGKPEVKGGPTNYDLPWFTGIKFTTSINPNGAPTTYYFEYGKTKSYGSTTAVKSAEEGTSFIPIEFRQNGLDPDSTYYFRSVATNSYGTTYGVQQSNSTAYWVPYVAGLKWPQSFESTGSFTVSSEKVGTVTCSQSGSGTISAEGGTAGVINGYSLSLSKCSLVGVPKCTVSISAPVNLSRTLTATETYLMNVDFSGTECAATDMLLKSEEPFGITKQSASPGITQTLTFSAITHFGVNPITLSSSMTLNLSGGQKFFWE